MEGFLYEDNHLLVVNKKGGVATQRTGRGQSLEERCQEQIKVRDGKRGNVYLHAVHRLDKVVSGVVLFAKSRKALSRLNRSLRDGAFDKRYLAVVEGRPPEDSGILIHTMCHGSHRAYLSASGKEARLRYRVQESNGTTLVDITLETGRYHQIRLQMSSIGCPVVGDYKYGATMTWQPGTIALQHYALTFPHPITGLALTVTLPALLHWE